MLPPSNVMFSRLEQSLNSRSGREVTPTGIVMAVSDEQPSNARSPMLVTLCGIEMLRSALQPRKPDAGIDVSPTLITTVAAHGYDGHMT